MQYEIAARAIARQNGQAEGINPDKEPSKMAEYVKLNYQAALYDLAILKMVDWHARQRRSAR